MFTAAAREYDAEGSEEEAGRERHAARLANAEAAELARRGAEPAPSSAADGEEPAAKALLDEEGHAVNFCGPWPWQQPEHARGKRHPPVPLPVRRAYRPDGATFRPEPRVDLHETKPYSSLRPGCSAAYKPPLTKRKPGFPEHPRATVSRARALCAERGDLDSENVVSRAMEKMVVKVADAKESTEHAAAVGRGEESPRKAALERSQTMDDAVSLEGAELVMLIDNRERGYKLPTSKAGMTVESRALPLGDVLWVWRTQLGDKAREYLTGVVLERKTLLDLSASIKDGRYDEQKYRLSNCAGLETVVFLVEGNLEEVEARGHDFPGMLPASTLRTAIRHTQLLHGLHVLQSASKGQTAHLLQSMHQQILRRAPERLTGCLRYEKFAEAARKSWKATVHDTFGRMLRALPGCGPAAVDAILEVAPTPRLLGDVLRDEPKQLRGVGSKLVSELQSTFG